MKYVRRTISLVSATALGAMMLSTEAKALETQTSKQASSSISPSDILNSHEETVSSDNDPSIVQTTPESTLLVDASQSAPSEVEQTSKLKQPTELSEQPTFETSAELLVPERPTETESIAQTLPSDEEVLPTPEEAIPDQGELDPGRRTRSGPSYIGIGGNFGTIGDSSVGESGLIIYSKIGLTRFFSVRPAITTDFEEDATFLFPATLDIAPIRINRDIRLAPYVGGGAAVTTQGDFGPLVVGGVDLPVTSNLTATAGINLGILDPVDLGVFVGIGYNFSGF